MTNLYIFWKESSDPPSPWTRLTRTNQYLRFSDSTVNHWVDTGATTHNHSNTITGYSCGSVNSSTVEIANTSGTYFMDNHTNHAEPTWSITNNNNNPPGYGLDIIYMDLATWEASEKRFPSGAVLMSNGSLVDAELSRFTDADGKYIYHATPGTSVGTSSAQSHTVSGTTGTGGSSSHAYGGTGGSAANYADHTHSVSLATTSTYPEPANLVTRLYYTLKQTSKALAETVVFVDGSVGSNWEILLSWSGYSLKSGDSDPTTSGTDTHTQTFSGASGNYSNARQETWGGSGWYGRLSPHGHTISGTLSAASHVPLSKQIVPARLLVSMYRPTGNRPQLIGITW